MRKKGISLITLIITIVVLLILATTIILTLNRTNIIDNAMFAKEMISKENMRDEIQLIISDALIEQKGVLTYEQLC